MLVPHHQRKIALCSNKQSGAEIRTSNRSGPELQSLIASNLHLNLSKNNKKAWQATIRNADKILKKLIASEQDLDLEKHKMNIRSSRHPDLKTEYSSKPNTLDRLNPDLTSVFVKTKRWSVLKEFFCAFLSSFFVYNSTYIGSPFFLHKCISYYVSFI